jgi:RNA polymerase sigma-70 factor (ECF subfamily)
MTARAPITESSRNGSGDDDGIDEHRPRLLGLAYRMLSDVDEAEDVVQEAFLRWQLADKRTVRSPEAWLMTVVTRLSVDRLRRLRTERSTYPGPWLPEPIATDSALAPASPPAPDRAAELASDLSVALLLLLERLAPEERAAFLLRDVFDIDYAEIARTLERSTDAVRQLVHRARTRVRSERARVHTPPGEHERLLEGFMHALTTDDAPALLALLAPDVILASDGGGRVRAALQRVVGADRVARFILGVSRKFGRNYSRRVTQLNGRPAVLVFDDGALSSATIAEVEGGRICALHVVRNPEKLRHVLEATVRLV